MREFFVMILLKFYEFKESFLMFYEFALIGTTASGKSELAKKLASEIKAIILSLDSLCVYKEINIASAKPDLATLKKVEHFGVNLLTVSEKFNVALFFDEYKRARMRAVELDKPLIIVGGTSFYLRALMNGLSQGVQESNSTISNDEIYELMTRVDKNSKIAKNDSYRLRKWLGIYESTGEVPSEFLKKTLQKPLIKELEIFELVLAKDELRARVEKRTQDMINSGLIEEARFLFSNFNPNLKPLNSIGLKECKAFLDGQITLAELPTLINTHTMQLAKRQRTFNKKFERVRIQGDDIDKVVESLKESLL